jgi:hypothetical protein
LNRSCAADIRWVSGRSKINLPPRLSRRRCKRSAAASGLHA